ncbi:hypothetical protein [Lutibacter sp.]|uniref:hypothetical protein n=1 Tax=Lutibacter sp. TaxID=1925666 RepID=UPI003567D32A
MAVEFHGDRKKEFTQDLKYIYTVTNQQAVRTALEDFNLKWNSKYFYAVDSLYKNWLNSLLF